MKAWDDLKGFWRNQSRNFKILLYRDIQGTLLNALMRQYTSIYMKQLGATALDISTLEGAASFVRMILAIPAGLFVDRVKSMKKLYVLSGLLLVPVDLVKGLAQDFRMYFATRMYESVVFRINMPTVNILNISAVSNRDRVKGMVTSRMLTSTVGLITPLLAAYLITYFGGLENVDSYRPLFYIQFVSSLLIFTMMTAKLEEPDVDRGRIDRNVLGSFSEMFRKVPGLKYILLMEIVLHHG